MVSVGDTAPDFTLMAAQDRSMVTLSEIGKRTVLAFYPAAFTGVCTTELCTFSESLGVLGEAEATVLGISADNNHQCNKNKWPRKNQFDLTFWQKLTNFE